MGEVMITADLMVGFPSESEEDFLDTLRFVGEARLLDAHVFAYSKREGTPAANYVGQIPESIKRERSARLTLEVRRVRDEILDGIVASEEPLMTVLEDEQNGRFRGHSDSYIEVSCTAVGHSRGDLVAVRPISHSDGVVFGEIIS